MTAMRISNEPATQSLSRFIKAALGKVLTWQRNEKAMHELAQCSDWMLADIGIRREQIRDVVHGGPPRYQIPIRYPVKPAMPYVQPDNDRAARKVA